jgi:hypothetical protein
MAKRYLIPIFHLLLIIAAWTSPFWLNWKIIILLYGLYLLQNIILGRCIISIAQFENNKESFYSHYLHKAGISWTTKKINFTADYIIPPLLILIALIYQKVISL